MQFRDGERVDSSTGTNEQLDAVKRSRSTCGNYSCASGGEVSVSYVGAVAKPLNRLQLDKQQIVVGRIVVGPLKRLNRPRPDGLLTVVVQDGVEVVCITLGNCHVEPQSRKARLWLVVIIIISVG